MTATVAGTGGISMPQTLATEFTVDIAVANASRLVYLGPRRLDGVPLWTGTKTNAAADGSPVAATRLDDTGSASGELAHDDRGAQFAVFDEPIAAGTWRFAVTEE